MFLVYGGWAVNGSETDKRMASGDLGSALTHLVNERWSVDGFPVSPLVFAPPLVFRQRRKREAQKGGADGYERTEATKPRLCEASGRQTDDGL